MGDQFEKWNRLAATFAREERDKHSTCEREFYVAGSVGTYGNFSQLDSEITAAHLRAQAELLVDCGVALLLLETLGSNLDAVRAGIEACSNLGVPVWVSLSCLRNRESGAMMFGIEEGLEASYVTEEFAPFSEAITELMGVGGSALLMMHSERQITNNAVKVMRENYTGPVGAYPNAGYWVRPNWAFVDQVTPHEYLADAKTWVASGATIIGGCCGIGVEHIRVLRDGLGAN